MPKRLRCCSKGDDCDHDSDPPAMADADHRGPVDAEAGGGQADAPPAVVYRDVAGQLDPGADGSEASSVRGPDARSMNGKRRVDDDQPTQERLRTGLAGKTAVK